MPDYLNFENRAKRREMMDQFRKEASGRDIPGYEDFTKKMEELDKLMEDCSKLDSFGLPKKMTEEMKKTLTDSIIKTAMAGETYLKNASQAAEKDPKIDLGKGVPGMVGKLQGMMANDLDAISAYDPKKAAKSMPEVLEDARSISIDADKRHLKKLGLSMSSRLAVIVVNAKGEKRLGVFTAANKLDFAGRFRNAIENAADTTRNQNEQETLRSILPKYKEYMMAQDASLKNKDDGYFADRFVREACGETAENHAGNEVEPAKLEALLGKIGITADDLNYTFDELVSQIEPLNDGVDHANLALAGMKDGCRVDVNNSGMSVVAGMLGKSKIVANAVPMKLRDEKGNVIEGTFMDYSKGLDLNTTDMNVFKALSSTPFNGSGGGFLRQLSDIQVMDYICGNVDRHFGNLMYKVNEKGKIIGVEAIDNDMSFGCFSGAEERRKELPGLANMNCITKSTKDKIMSLKPEMLKFSLRGRGLTEEQINFAGKRLKDIQQAIIKGEKHYEGRPPAFKDKPPFDKGFLRVIPDEHFSKLSIDKMYIKGKDKEEDQFNLFSDVDQWVRMRLKSARRAGYKHDPNYKKDDLRTEEGRTTDQKYSSAGFEKPLRGSSKLVKLGDFNVDDLTVKNNGSKQFDEMVKAAKLVHAIEKEYKKLGEANKPLTAVDYSHYVTRMKRAVKDLQDKKDAYLARKMGQRKAKSVETLVGKNEYERKRIDYAKKVDTWAEKAMVSINKNFKELDLDKLSEIEKADYTSIKEKESLEDRRAAMEALKKFHAEKGLANIDTEEGLKQAKEQLKANYEEMQKQKQGPQAGL